MPCRVIWCCTWQQSEQPGSMGAKLCSIQRMRWLLFPMGGGNWLVWIISQVWQKTKICHSRISKKFYLVCLIRIVWLGDLICKGRVRKRTWYCVIWIPSGFSHKSKHTPIYSLYYRKQTLWTFEQFWYLHQVSFYFISQKANEVVLSIIKHIYFNYEFEDQINDHRMDSRWPITET